MAAFSPQLHLREAAVQLAHTCLLYIDVQNYNCHPRGAEYACQDQHDNAYWWERLQEVKPLWSKLQDACREDGVEVMYTVIQSLTKDGRDRSLDYKISGFHVPPGSWDAQVIDEIRPADDEIVLPKTSSSVFISTNVTYLLHNLGVQNLLLCGCLTDQCVESAVRDACDLGFLVTLITDCCVTYSDERHVNSLKAIKGYCRQRTCSEMVEEVQSLAAKAS